VPANGGRALSIKKGLASIASISVTNINRKANARLIAAAPEMYEALQALIALAESGGSVEEPLEVIAAGREAIRKAEGEAA
jgi:hypothetical protein